MTLARLSAFLALPAILSAQQLTQVTDSVSLRVGEVRSFPATLRGASGAVTYSGNTTAFTAHRDGRITGRGAGCGLRRASFAELARVTMKVCVVARDTVVPPVVTPVPPTLPTSPRILFRADWPTVGGHEATLSGGAFSFQCCLSATTSGVRAVSLPGWPTPNAYIVGVRSGASTVPTHQVTYTVEAPKPGESRYFRLYQNVPYSDAHGTATPTGSLEHGLETSQTATGGSARGWNVIRLPRGDGTWFLGFREISTGWRFVGGDLRLRKNATYRLEWALHYGDSTYTVELRVYDAAGVLVATEADLVQVLPSVRERIPLSGIKLRYTAEGHRTVHVGTNGPTSGFPMTGLVDGPLYWNGAFAQCTSWCGAYKP